jgi:hypothetical protein
MPSDTWNIPYPVRTGDADSVPTHVQLELPGSRPRFQNFTLLAGQLYKKGSVLGVITASGKLTLSASAAGDGSQTPIAVLNIDVDATAADVKFDVMVGGAVLNPAALVLGTGLTSAAAQTALLARGFAFRTPGFSG